MKVLKTYISETNYHTLIPFTSSQRSLGKFFHARLTHMLQLVTFGELNNNVDTTRTSSMRVVASRLAIPCGCPASFRMQYGRQPPTRKSIRFWDNKLRTTGSLLRVKFHGKS
jgi:hypothetical protein